MENKFRRNQDLDLGIRLAKLGVFLIRKREVLAIHNTISYHNNKRMWILLFNGGESFRSVLLRDNIFNKFQWRMFLRENYTSIILLTSLFFICMSIYYICLIYLCIVILRVLYKKKYSFITFLNRVAYFIVRDFLVWISLFIFWPSNKKRYKIQEL